MENAIWKQVILLARKTGENQKNDYTESRIFNK